MTRSINDAGLQMIKGFEGLRLFAYPDPASPLAKASPNAPWGFKPARDILATLPSDKVRLSGAPWTAGYGHAGVTPDTACTEAQAEQWLRADLAEAEATIEHAVHVPLNDNQFSALVSWCFNCGSAAVERSTLIRKLNQGNYEAVPSELAKWTFAGKQRLQGLANRRAAEAGLFVRDSFVASASVEVDNPRKIEAADTAGSVSASVGTAGAIISEAANQVSYLSQVSKVASLLFLVLIVAGVSLKIWSAFRKNK